MTREVRRFGIVLVVLFGALIANLHLLQLLRAEALGGHQANRRAIIAEYQVERGPIVVAGSEIVRSTPTRDDLAYLRVYDQGPLYAHVTGWYSFVLLRSGLEQAFNDQLTGTPRELLNQNLAALLSSSGLVGATVELTLDPRVQQAARAALGDRVGAVVALEPTTGRVLASYSSPSYDPGILSTHNGAEILGAWDALNADPTRPLLDRVTRGTFAPGSVFKLIVAAAALEQGLEPSTSFEDTASYTPPQTRVAIENYTPGPCGDGQAITLADALRVSCNTVFARLAVDLGADRLAAVAEGFGFNRDIPYDLPTLRSRLPKDLDDPATAQSALGQRDVRTTPLHMALVAAAIANEGRLVRPHVVAQVRNASGRVVRGPNEGPWVEGRFSEQAVTPTTAALLREMMVDVVARGTGSRAAIPGVEVGGKTGTAEDPNATPTAWFVGFAGSDVAVAVVLPDAGADATGGAVAAPIAQAVMETALGLR